jgi:lipid II:glycine glycyltransferase (peptidoglycan interpeptide bridge formation enzyme)
VIATSTVDQVTALEWSEICKRFHDYSIYQTWGFGEISAADTGSQLSRIVVKKGEIVIGAAQVRIKKLPLLPTGLAYVYFGPLGSRWSDSIDEFSAVLRCLRNEYAERRGLEVRILPNLWERHTETSRRQVLCDSGFSPSKIPPPYRTIMVDLSPTLEELRANLAQKWRNGLNQAEKRGVTVEARVDDEAMRLFEKLYETMWSKKQFETGVTVSSFRRLQQLLPPDEKLTIHLAYKDGTLAAGHVSSTLGDTCVYLLGASNDMGRDCKASYSLQWQAITAAKKAGARRFDLGGIDPNKNPGVYHFKAGLGGLDTSYVGRYEARARGVGRYLVPLAERVYRTVDRFLSREKVQERAVPRPSQTKARSSSSCPTMAKLSS